MCRLIPHNSHISYLPDRTKMITKLLFLNIKRKITNKDCCLVVSIIIKTETNSKSILL